MYPGRGRPQPATPVEGAIRRPQQAACAHPGKLEAKLPRNFQEASRAAASPAHDAAGAPCRPPIGPSSPAPSAGRGVERVRKIAGAGRPTAGCADIMTGGETSTAESARSWHSTQSPYWSSSGTQLVEGHGRWSAWNPTGALFLFISACKEKLIATLCSGPVHCVRSTQRILCDKSRSSGLGGLRPSRIRQRRRAGSPVETLPAKCLPQVPRSPGCHPRGRGAEASIDVPSQQLGWPWSLSDSGPAR